MKGLILFICNGNIHRSVVAALTAERLIRVRGLNDRYEVLSRGLQGTMGTSPAQHRNLREYPVEWSQSGPPLLELGLDIPQTQESTPVTRDIMERASIVFAMDRLIFTEKPNCLARQFLDLIWKIRLFSEIGGTLGDIPDPAGSNDPALHRATIEMIVSTVDQNFDRLEQLIRAVHR